MSWSALDEITRPPGALHAELATNVRRTRRMRVNVDNPNWVLPEVELTQRLGDLYATQKRR